MNRIFRRGKFIVRDDSLKLNSRYGEIMNMIKSLDEQTNDLISKINSNRTVKENIKIFLEGI